MKPNASDTTLDIALKPIFSSDVTTSAQDINCRDLFYTLIHSNDHSSALPQSYLFLKRQLQSVSHLYAGHFSQHYSPTALSALVKKTTPSHGYPLPEESLHECFVLYSPIFFTEPSWLATSVQTVTCQTPLALALMALYSRLTVGEFSIAKSREIYRAFLLNAGFDVPAIHTIAFAEQSQIGDPVFNFATVQLALAQFPRVFFPEILGFTLLYCQTPSLLEQFFPENNGSTLPDFIILRNQRRKQEVAPLLDVIKTYLHDNVSDADRLWQRIQTGFWLHQAQLEHCDHCLTEQLHTRLSPRQAMEKLLSTLAPSAIGHHGKIRLGGKSLDEWFSEKPFKSANFLASFLHTPYVDRNKPEHSQLLQLFEFGGPMFGVLDQIAKNTVKDWLLSELNPGLSTGKKHNPTAYKVGLKSITHLSEPEQEPVAVTVEMQQIEKIDFYKLNNNELYFYLINSDIYPEVLPAAKRKAQSILNWAKHLNRPPFRQYTHDAFESFINGVYQHEVKAYQPLNKKPKLTKNTYVWGIEQFTPTILIDGCWLQANHQLNYFSTHTTGTLLHKIFQDEIGNGILEQNHPHIFQTLLDSLSITLPPPHTQAFINHPGFLRSAFDIPVYLMAISKFPTALLPELLGLNMAIEISGLGREYLRLSEALNFWGINSAIVDIHTSIDNLSSGHSALAMQSIKTYLDDISAAYGEDMMQAHWRRIYTGYCSLQTASWRFKYALIAQTLLKRQPDP